MSLTIKRNIVALILSGGPHRTPPLDLVGFEVSPVGRGAFGGGQKACQLRRHSDFNMIFIMISHDAEGQTLRTPL